VVKLSFCVGSKYKAFSATYTITWLVFLFLHSLWFTIGGEGMISHAEKSVNLASFEPKIFGTEFLPLNY